MNVSMPFLFRLLGISMLVSLLAYVGCSSGDEPQPVDCSASDLAVEVLPAGISNPPTCSNSGSITATASGGRSPYTYSINNSGTFQASPTFLNLGPGSYSITVRDADNCTKTATNVVLTAPNSPSAGTPAVEADTACDTDNGSITVTATGGTGSYTYSIDGTVFQTSNVFSGLRAGNYVVSVKDDANCTVTTNAAVPNGTGVTYDHVILPILRAKCEFGGCHPTNGNWFDYNTALSKAATIKLRTGNRTMPQGGASAPGGELSDEQINLIACWVDHGAPKN